MVWCSHCVCGDRSGSTCQEGFGDGQCLWCNLRGEWAETSVSSEGVRVKWSVGSKCVGECWRCDRRG